MPAQISEATQKMKAFGSTLRIAQLANVTSANIVDWRFSKGTNAIGNPLLQGRFTTDTGHFVTFLNGEIKAYAAPDVFFWNLEVDLKKFVGKPRLSEREAILKVRHYIEALGVRPKGRWWRKNPELERPTTRGKHTVPRLGFDWMDDESPFITEHIFGEIDTSDGILRQLYLEPSVRLK